MILKFNANGILRTRLDRIETVIVIYSKYAYNIICWPKGGKTNKKPIFEGYCPH
jgi:hypothetical protein